jgi:hypothetical protein
VLPQACTLPIGLLPPVSLMTECNLFQTLKTRNAKYYNVTLNVPSYNQVCSGKAIYIKYSECVFVALSIQHAVCMRRIILSSVSCPALQHFSTLFPKRHDFRGGGEGAVV